MLQIGDNALTELAREEYFRQKEEQEQIHRTLTYAQPTVGNLVFLVHKCIKRTKTEVGLRGKQRLVHEGFEYLFVLFTTFFLHYPT